MKRNRKVSKKMSVTATITTHFGAVLAVLFVMVILNILASSSCQHLMKSIGRCEKELARLEDARNRQAANWEAMKTPEKVEVALLRNGLRMRPPKAEQNIHMQADGTPYRGQYAVATARRRNSAKSAENTSRAR